MADKTERKIGPMSCDENVTTPHLHATLQAKGEGAGGWGECPFFPCVSIHVDVLFTQFSIYKVT